MDKKIIDRLNELKSRRQQLMIQANKMDGEKSTSIKELSIRINELQRLIE